QLGIVTTAVPTHDGPIAGLALNGEFLAWLLLADSVKPEARQALQELRDLGLGRQLLLTGDRQSVADSLALDVGISDVEAQALPEDKLNR
ncbi:HAD family hydrolase, partial [Vibrio cholerae]